MFYSKDQIKKDQKGKTNKKTVSNTVGYKHESLDYCTINLDVIHHLQQTSVWQFPMADAKLNKSTKFLKNKKIQIT